MDVDAARARDRLVVAGGGAATSLATFDFVAGRDRPALFAFGFLAALTALGDSLGSAGAAGVASLRPNSRAFAMIDRCSE